MKRLFLIFLAGVAGYVVGYFAGVELACDWVIPKNNLCGIYAVFITGPIGLLLGIVAGGLMSRPVKG